MANFASPMHTDILLVVFLSKTYLTNTCVNLVFVILLSRYIWVHKDKRLFQFRRKWNVEDWNTVIIGAGFPTLFPLDLRRITPSSYSVHYLSHTKCHRTASHRGRRKLHCTRAVPYQQETDSSDYDQLKKSGILHPRLQLLVVSHCRCKFTLLMPPGSQ